jgi:hypothetical protein
LPTVKHHFTTYMYNNSAGNYYRQIKLTHCCIHAD